MSLVENALRRLRETAQPQRLPGAGPGPAEAGGRMEPGSKRRIVFDRRALRAAGLLPPESQDRQISRQYRQIKRPLIAAATGRGGAQVGNERVILVTSAVPGEGKTFTALNLALSLAQEQDHAVVLVDLDVPKPNITEELGLRGEPGVLDALRDPSLDIASLVISTDVPSLCVVPVGATSTDATELLTSSRMQEVLHQLAGPASGYIAVIDSPPVLLTSEAPALAELAGQIVVVVRAGHTSQQHVLDALELVNARSNASLIMNQSVTNASQEYNYGYGYGSRQEQSGQRKPGPAERA